jgi:hypothetical protein
LRTIEEVQRIAASIAAALGLCGLALGGIACAGGESSAETTAQLRTPPVPAGIARDDDFTVRARTPGGSWRDVGVYAVKVDLEQPSTVGMAVLEASGPVELAVTRKGPAMNSVRIRPDRAKAHAVLSEDGRTAYFTIRRPANLSVEPNGDTHANLQLFVNPITRRTPRTAGRRVIRFAPGVHELPGDHILRVPSRTTVELAPGAVVHGRIEIRKARDVIVRGSGVLDPSAYFDKLDGPTGVFIDRSSDVGVTGITLLRGQNGGVSMSDVRNVVVENVKQINADEWSDGSDIAGARNVLIDGCFYRTSDDSIAIWATSPWIGSRSTRNVTVRDTVLWPDLAHAVLIGPFGDPQGAEVISDIDFQGLDVLQQKEDNPLYQGTLAVNAGDNLTIHDVRFDDVRIDEISQGQAVNVRVFLNPDYKTVAGNAVHDVLFRDVDVDGGDDRPSEVSGYSSVQVVSDVLFENVRRQGDPIARDAAAFNTEVGPYAANVAFEVGRPFVTWDDDDPRLRFSRGWSEARAAGAHDGDVRRSDLAGATLTVPFSGRQARLIGATTPSSGHFEVWVDRRFVRRIETYSGRADQQRTLFDTGALAPGRHTLRVRVTGTRNVLSAGKRLDVDAVEVVP